MAMSSPNQLFAHFGCPPQKPTGFASPYVADEPVRVGLEGGQIGCKDDGELTVVGHGKMTLRAAAT
jgi:hypothetical protein